MPLDLTNTTASAGTLTQTTTTATIVVGGVTYVFVGSFNEGRLETFTLDAAGVLTLVGSTPTPLGSTGLSIADVGGTAMLFAGGFGGVQTFAIGAGAALTPLSSLPDNGNIAAGGSVGLTTFTTGGATYLATAEVYGTGISLFSVSPTGVMSETATVTTISGVSFSQIYTVEAVTIGVDTYLVATTFNNAVGVLRVGPGGTVTEVQALSDDGITQLGGPCDLTVAVVGGATYVVVSAFSEGGVSVFSMAADGSLTNVFNQPDTGVLNLGAAWGVDSFVQDGVTYVAVNGTAEGAYQFMILNADGSLTPAEQLVNPGGNYNYQTREVTVGGSQFLLFPDYQGGELSVFRLGSSAAPPAPDSAKDDAFATAENAGFVGNVRADNGSGADSPSLAITEVNGNPAAVGMQITLPSGALLKLNANGTFQYIPNGAFNSLAGAGSGATNTSGTDSFTYTAANGDTATVTVTINGVDSNGDVLIGTGGNDNLSAGTGSDTVNAGAGNDTVDGGDGNDTLNGEAGNDTLNGGAGIDTLNGGTGADAMAGGIGNDTYVVDNTGDTVTEGVNAGTDLVQASIDYILGANVENLTLTGSGHINGIGNALNNVITGNTGSNTLIGGLGNDVLSGAAGDDTLSGGAGIDTLNGDAGNDVLDGGAGGDKMFGGAGSDTLIGGADADTMDGGIGDDTLTGAGGNDSLQGGQGKDVMRGGDGNDAYYVDNTLDEVIELGNQGDDVVRSTVSFVLGNSVEVLHLDGTGAINGTGGADHNRIFGNSASNTLDGGAGDDILTGGAGNDTYIVDSSADQVIELAGGGTFDHVKASVTYVLANEVENLTLTGSAAINGTGNSVNNTIVGNDVDNVIRALAGNDAVSAGGGNDTVLGGEGSDNLKGEAGDDVLTGGTGNDTLAGGTGADRFVVLQESIRLSASSGAAIETDNITDFNAGAGDRIDLSSIDANGSLAGDQAFTVVGTFSSQAGQATMAYDAGQNLTTLRLDIDGDGIADYQLRVTGDATGAAILDSNSAPSAGGWLL